MKSGKEIRKKFSGLKLKLQFNIIITILVVIPMLLSGAYIFHEMNENTISTARTYMQDTMEREETSVNNHIQSLQMSTQYLLEDQTIHEMLCDAAEGKKMDTAQLRDVYEKDIHQIEQLLYSNPSLYSLRVYATSDNVTEMMPVLYGKSRMERQPWAQKENPKGYYFDYTDHIFVRRDVQDADHLIGMITPVDDDDDGRIGYIETSIGIAYLFPDILTPEKDEESFLVLSDGNVVHDQNSKEAMLDTARSTVKQKKHADGVSTEQIHNENGNYMVSSLYLDDMDAHYVSVMDLSTRLSQQNRQKFLLLVLFGAVIVVLWLITDTAVDWLLKDFYRILETVYQVQNGDLSVRVSDLGEGDTAVLGNEINHMLDRIDDLMKENLTRGLMEKNAQIRALENQINAHFIYNVLESINMMAEIDGDYAICDAVVALGNMMRYSLRWTNGMVTIADEVNYVQNYVELMNIRLDGQVHAETDISEDLMNNEIPKMVLQPLVENAITHGYAGSDEPAQIEIHAEVRDEKTYVDVRDHGCGMSDEELASLLVKMREDPQPDQKHGYALHNIHERIRYVCGNDYGLTITSEKGKGTVVTVVLPHETIRKQESV